MASAEPPRKQISIRVPRELYDRSCEIAGSRGIGLNALIQEGLSRIESDEQKNALYDAFTLLGEDKLESDVAYALAAQSEVVLRGDNPLR